jgi:sugar diacid utilization regulator
MKKGDLSISEEIRNTLGEDTSTNLASLAVNHRMLFRGITEYLLFSDGKYKRMDMSFLINISSLDYGKRYRVILLKSENHKNSEVYEKIGSDIRDKYGIVLMTIWERLLICILPEKLIDASAIMNLYYYIEKKYGTIKIAASTIKEKLEDSHVGLQEAIRTYDMIDTMKKHKENFMFYEDLGIWHLLYELNESSVFESYCNSMFQDLWRYDENNDGHLFTTLECFFHKNCDKAMTAKELFIHENTLRYRLHQIEDIMHKDLKDVDVIADIVTALKVRRMIQILDKT